MKRLLVLVILVVIALMLFGLPKTAEGNAPHWKTVPNFPAKWRAELGERPGDIILSVEYQCERKMPIYTLLKRCEKANNFSSIGWTKGDRVARERTCTGAWVLTESLGLWEGRGGPLPERPPDMCNGKKRGERKK